MIFVSIIIIIIIIIIISSLAVLKFFKTLQRKNCNNIQLIKTLSLTSALQLLKNRDFICVSSGPIFLTLVTTKVKAVCYVVHCFYIIFLKFSSFLKVAAADMTFFAGLSSQVV